MKYAAKNGPPAKQMISTIPLINPFITSSPQHKSVLPAPSTPETFEKWSVLPKFKAGKNLNRRNTWCILRIKI
jgi:hypothetical protein